MSQKFQSSTDNMDNINNQDK